MSIVYVVSPTLTVRTSPVAEKFEERFYQTAGLHASVVILRTAGQMQPVNPNSTDAVIFFNRPDPAYEEHFLRFLRRAAQAGASILPVAATRLERQPPADFVNRQSFDLVEQLRERGLEDGQVGIIADVFARQVLSIIKPTLFAEPMQLFLCHRRFDGEEIAATFQQTLRATAQSIFRDLFSVRVGEDAQEIIDKQLRESDAVIFLDTPRSGESVWIAKELQTALSFQIPVVWVRLGSQDGRVDLRVLPAETPHFILPQLNPLSDEVPLPAIEKIVNLAFDVHRRDYVDRLLDEWNRLTDLANKIGIQLTSVDPKQMLYSLTLPRKAGRYRQRPLTHLLQLFGRAPTRRDMDNFSRCAHQVGFESHPKHGHHYDSAILLAAIPPQLSASFDDCGVHTDSIGDYIADFEKELLPARKLERRIVISGAFADCEPQFQQNMTYAVHAMTEAALRWSNGVSFGAHPTFQFLIFDLAKRLRPDDYKSAVRMYVSKYFVTEATLDELRTNAEVIATPETPENRASSLSLMRTAMLNDQEATALVVIGGKTTPNGHTPGVDEEIRLARAAGLRVYIFGSVGGRSSELSATMTPEERQSMNGLSPSADAELATSSHYARLAKLIIDSSFR